MKSCLTRWLACAMLVFASMTAHAAEGNEILKRVDRNLEPES